MFTEGGVQYLPRNYSLGEKSTSSIDGIKLLTREHNFDRLIVMAKKLNLTGKEFGKWTVLRDSGKRTTGGTILWFCECNCRVTSLVSTGNLRTARSRGCVGCRVEGGKTTHGDSHSRLYRIWSGMKSRCYYSGDDRYHRYGERGIEICLQWKNSYIDFKKWALANGYNDNLTIDRIDNDGNYCPENCQWITGGENASKYHRVDNIHPAGYVYLWFKLEGICRD